MFFELTMNREAKTHKKVSNNTKDIREKAILIGIEFLSNGSSPLGTLQRHFNSFSKINAD